ncbi:peptidylprolyl isomerase [Hyphococcus sp.]|uniref:peptidylprolyl isomerase n=1 Tax=Hyphococcus sp. TaxID=2038636 RepID=UPI003CCC15E1
MNNFMWTLAPALLLSTQPVLADALEGKPSPAAVLENADPSDWRALDPEYLLVIELEYGRVIVALSSQLAQNHVSQIKALARESFYDGLSFYRVIDGFVAQGGDAFETREVKTAKSALNAEFDEPYSDNMTFTPIKDLDGYTSQVGFIDSLPAGVDETSETVWHLHCAGAMALGRTDAKDSAATEFYIALQPQRYLDRNLSVFGRVVEGMEHLQALRRITPPQTQEDDQGETIISMRVATDLPADQQPSLEILRSGTETFDAYVEARRNRPEAFFYHRPNHVDICALNIPVRSAESE